MAGDEKTGRWLLFGKMSECGTTVSLGFDVSIQLGTCRSRDQS